MRTAVLIPSLEPDEHLLSVIQGCIQEGLEDVVVIDDGSGADYQSIFDQAEALGAYVIRYAPNRGKGAALKIGLAAARERFPDLAGVVTADADGQHLPQDIRRVAEQMEKTGAFVLGVRDFSGEDVPLRSRLGNHITAALFLLSTGVRCSDTQTGLRGLPASLFDRLLEIPGERYEYELNMLGDMVDRKFPMEMVPIQTVYEDNNRSSHFRTVADSARIYQRPLKFMASSGVSCVIDLILFHLLSGIWPIMAATVGARCVSAYVNFKLTQRWCFQVRKRTREQFIKYAILCVCVMLLSGGAVTALQGLPLPLTLIKVLVDLALFVVNYFVQRRFIFREDAGGIF